MMIARAYQKSVASGAIAVLAVASWAVARAQEVPRWEHDTLRTFALLPVQDGGRVKPLETFANVKLLQLNGRRSCRTEEGAKLTAMEWFLDCLFFPDRARAYKSFLIENTDVASMLGLAAKKERDRYAYNDLAPARQTLFQLAQHFSATPEEARSLAQTQLIHLAHNIREFEFIVDSLQFAQHPITLGQPDAFSAILPASAPIRLSEVLANAPALRAEMLRLSSMAGEGNPSTGIQAMRDLANELDRLARSASYLALIPPAADDASREWLTPARLIEQAFTGKPPAETQVEIVRRLENLMSAAPGTPQFRLELAALYGAARSLADARGEYAKVPLEVAYHRAQLFYYSLVLYVLGFLAVALTWIRPNNRWLAVGALAAVAAPTALLTAGIVLRCIIRSRPPVTTLYETILFITAVAVCAALFLEWVNRKRIGLSLAAALGMLGMFVAGKYELVERNDTMPSMVAVLDTNFWLSTHVTTVTMGYAAGLLASACAHVYLIGKLLRFKRHDPEFYATLARMTYGVVCFGLIFATVGTILGGIWANYSWGRFWGWDPKENGALMIVLWFLILLHARIAGYIREYGIVLCAVFGGMIVAFSWFGVNLLGVGLHSYGFTSGIAQALQVFYAVETAVLFLGALGWFLNAAPRPANDGTSSAGAPRHVQAPVAK